MADYAEDSSDAARAFGKAYRDAPQVAPDNQSSWTFDAVTVLAKAINAAGKTDPQAIREAILAIKGHDGAEGTYNFDANGDGLHGYNVVRNDKGNIVFDKHVDFQRPDAPMDLASRSSSSPASASARSTPWWRSASC